MLENRDFSLGLVTLDYYIRQPNGLSSSHLDIQVQCVRKWSDFNIYILGTLAEWQNLKLCHYLWSPRK